MAASARHISYEAPDYFRSGLARRAPWTGCRAAEASAAWVAQVRFLRAMESLSACRRTAVAQHQLTHTEAAALADAGVMPLPDYLDLASRNGWVDGHA